MNVKLLPSMRIRMALLLTGFDFFQLPLYTAPSGGTKPGRAEGPIRFCGARYKDKASAACGGCEWVVMATYSYSLPLPLFETNHDRDRQEIVFTTKILNESEKMR